VVEHRFYQVEHESHVRLREGSGVGGGSSVVGALFLSSVFTPPSRVCRGWVPEEARRC
jgi:hypothetical protein